MAAFISANQLTVSPAETGSNLVKPLALRAMFWRPSYLAASSCLEHIPFAFWIIEASQPKVFVELGADYGASYFAHCQAVDKLGLDTQCYAIDTWMSGDATAGQENGAFEKVNAYNESQYSGFSHLLRSNFDDAARNFADGTIDLLHINGLHTSGFALRDFEIWLPKLSEHGIVLLHGTNSRERNFGTFKLFEQLQTRYPTFEFSFGQGLGLIAAGNEQNEMIQLLLDAHKNERAKQAIHEVFFRLGRACADSLTVIKHKESIQNLNEVLGQQNNQLTEIRRAFETAQAELTHRSDELNDARSAMNVQTEHHAIERGQLSERITLLQEIRSDLKQEVEKWQARTDTAAADLHRRIEEMSRLEQTNSAHRHQIENIAQQLQARETTIVSLQNEVATKEADIEALKIELAQNQSANAVLAQEITAHQQHTVVLKETNATKQAEIEVLQESSATKQATIEAQQAELAARNDELAQLQSSKQALDDENMRLKNANAAQAQEIVGHQQHTELLQEVNGAKEADIEALKIELAQNQSANAVLAQEITAHQQHTVVLKETNATKQAEIEVLQESSATKQATIEAQQAELAARNDELAQLQSSKHRLADENLKLQQTISTLTQETKDHRHHVVVLQGKLQDKENAAADLTEKVNMLTQDQAKRFDEIAVLTQDLITTEQTNEHLTVELKTRGDELAQLQSSKHRLADENLKLQQTISTLTQETKDHRHHVVVLQGKLQDKENAAADLTEKVNMLTQDQAKRFDEIAVLTQDLITTEQTNEHLTVELKTRGDELAQLQSSKQALDDENMRLKNANAAQAQEIVGHQQHTEFLQEANGNKQMEIEALNGKLEARFKELAEMTRHLMANEEAINKKNQQLHILQKQALGWKNDSAWKQPMRMPFRKADKYQKQIEQILLSGLFDTEWYLKQYPDVAKFGKHPVAHYLSFGAAENRDPSPVFCTAAYRAANREALADGKNPLLHYLEIESQRTAGPNQ